MREGEERFEQGSRDHVLWKSTGNVRDLESALEQLRQARYLPWRSEEKLPACLALTVDALEEHLEARPECVDADRDQLIEVLTVMECLADAGSADKALIHSKRGWQRMLRYISKRSFDDLNDAVVDFKTALSLTPADSTSRYVHALNVAWSCEERFDRTQSRGQQYRRLVIDDPSLDFHFDMTGPYDLVVPISHLESLLVRDPVRQPPSPLMSAQIKRNLANMLRKYAVHVRVERSAEQRIADLQQAVDLLQQALDESEEDRQLQLTVVSSLETAMITRLLTKEGRPISPSPALDSPDLDRRIARLAELGGSVSHPEHRARLQMTLAALLLRRQDHADREKAAALFRALASTPAEASAEISLSAAVSWANYEVSRKRWQSVIEAHQHGMLRVRTLIASQPDWLNGYRVTQCAGQLAALAAYAYIQLGKPAAAVAVLDSGRALMFAAQTETSVARPHPIPTSTRVMYLLYADEGVVALSSTAQGDWVARPLAEPLPVDELQRYLVELDEFRRDPNQNDQLFFQAVDDVVRSLRQALSRFAGSANQDDLDVVVIPVGALTLFPVGAALIDKVPTAGAVTVLPTRRFLQPPTEQPGSESVGQLLVVRDPTLDAAGYEERVIKRFFPDALSLPDDAPKAAILAAAPRGGVVHFACHATAEPGAPLSSAIILPNGERLSVSDLLGGAVPPLRLAVLSACETGVSDPSTPDEVVSLAAALLATQTQGVISTLWPVEDLSTALLMAHFYWDWRVNGTRPPVALTRAQRWQASSTNNEKIDFVRALGDSRILDRQESQAITDYLGSDSRSLSDNMYSHPYFWAGFMFSGR